MKDITTTDLREALTLLVTERVDDGEGGWKEQWKKGDSLWGAIWPLGESEGYQRENPGGPNASEGGYTKPFPPPRFRLVIRAEVELPPQVAFLWQLPRLTKRLLITSAPTFIQFNRFCRMTVREDLHA